jgi:hypothetical protein
MITDRLPSKELPAAALIALRLILAVGVRVTYMAVMVALGTLRVPVEL